MLGSAALRSPSIRRHLPALIFVLVAVLRVALTVAAGAPYPKGPRSDENVYLELAWNLFSFGEYGSRVSVTYPPLYPMFVAPFFGIDSNTQRFAALYAAQAALGSLALLALLRPFSDLFGRPRAWIVLAVLQALSGSVTMARTAQSEPLFIVLLTLSVGVAYRLWQEPRFGPAFVLGLLTGLAITTRRTALVMPVAITLLLLQDLWEGRGKAIRPTTLRAAALLLGGAVGLSPEWIASHLHGGHITPYSEGVAANHMSAVTDAVRGWSQLLLALRVSARQLAYLNFVTLGAPLVLGLLLVGRRAELRPRLPEAVQRVGAFVLWLALGLAALSSMHILRYWFSVWPRAGWDVYPRYLDPVEVPLVAGAALVAGWALKEATAETAEGGHWSRRALPWFGWGALLAMIPGPTLRPRGGRLSWIDVLIDHWPRPAAAMAFFVVCLAVVALSLWVWRRGRWSSWRGAGLAALLSWLIVPQTLWVWLRNGFEVPPPPALLRHKDLLADPDRPLAVVVAKVGAFSRHYYEPAFRSDHPVWFLSKDEVAPWLREKPDGYVLTFKGDPTPGGSPRARIGSWRLWDAARWTATGARPESTQVPGSDPAQPAPAESAEPPAPPNTLDPAGAAAAPGAEDEDDGR